MTWVTEHVTILYCDILGLFYRRSLANMKLPSYYKRHNAQSSHCFMILEKAKEGKLLPTNSFRVLKTSNIALSGANLYITPLGRKKYKCYRKFVLFCFKTDLLHIDNDRAASPPEILLSIIFYFSWRHLILILVCHSRLGCLCVCLCLCVCVSFNVYINIMG